MALGTENTIGAVWVRMPLSGIFPGGGGYNSNNAWNPGLGAADPATGVGGIDLKGVAGRDLTIILQGSDVNIAMNTGAGFPGFVVPFLPGGTPDFVGDVPRGFIAGWPDGSGNAAALDAAGATGSAIVASGGYELQCPATYGACPVNAAWKLGNFYFEVVLVANAFDSNYAGAGVGLRAGASDATWPFDASEGCCVAGGILATNYAATVTALNKRYLTASANLQFTQYTVLSFAVALRPQYQYLAQGIQPVALANVQCCPPSVHGLIGFD